MPSLTSRLGLKRPLKADSFLTQDIYDYLTSLDAYPGDYICTEGTRPVTWGAAHDGMKIWETDTSLRWRWNGTIFVRDAPKGLLGYSELTSDFATSATSPTSVAPDPTAITCTVAVPKTTVGSTTKRIRVTASFYAIDNGDATTKGIAEVSLYRNGTPTQLFTARVTGRPDTAAQAPDVGNGGTIVGWDAPAVAGGSLTYSLRVNSLAAVGGTTTLRASATTRATLTVEEVGV